MKAGSTDYCAELILLTSIYLLDLLHRRQSMHVIRKIVDMRPFFAWPANKTKIHYLAISKHAPSSRAIDFCS